MDEHTMSRAGRIRLSVAICAALVAVIAESAPTVRAAVTNSSTDAGDSESVLAVLENVLGDSCLTSKEAAGRISSHLDSSGFEGWTIDSSRVRAASCVSAGVDAASREVVLIPIDGPRVTAALETARRELMSRCLDEHEASSLISEVVMELGVTDFEVRSDGPFSYPLDEEDAVLAHVEAGCFVYTGVAHDESGKAIYFVSQGPTASASPSATER